MSDVTFQTIGKKEKREIECDYNFLFLVHNEIEFEEFIEKLYLYNAKEGIKKYIDNDNNKQCYFLGKLGLYNIVLAKTADMGSMDINAAANVVNNAIDCWKPNFVLMVGVAAGLDDDCKIGDVILARDIIAYERMKKGTPIDKDRSPRFSSPRLFNLFDGVYAKNFSDRTPPFEGFVDMYGKGVGGELRKGTLLSGEKLLDNEKYKSELSGKFPEALALDMEGAGVASACLNKRVYNWIIIKGICDFGDGKKSYNKEKNQHFAMRQALRLVESVFTEKGSFSQDEFKLPIGMIRKNSVLISASQTPESGNFASAEPLCVELAKGLAEREYKTVTGYGKYVGEYTVRGVLQAVTHKCEEVDTVRYDNYLRCYPFPNSEQSLSAEERNKLTLLKHVNRKLLFNNVGSVIFLYGFKEDGGKVVPANGMEEEFDLALATNAFIVPVGATGGTAEQIWERVRAQVEKYYPGRTAQERGKLEKGLDALGKRYDLDVEEQRAQLIQSIFSFLDLR